jgi:hypothetical protein
MSLFTTLSAEVLPMSEAALASITDVDPEGVMRTISALISELGAFSAALILHDTVYRLTRQEGAARLAETLAGYFPLYGEIIENDLSPAEAETVIHESTGRLIEQLRTFSSIVVVGIESVILDTLTRKLPEARFYLIPHSETLEAERVLANFPPNVHLIDVREIMELGGTHSVLLSYAFCQAQEDAFIYPVTFRAVGPDVRSSYNRIIGLNILSGYNRYLDDMAPLYSTSQFFTHQFGII